MRVGVRKLGSVACCLSSSPRLTSQNPLILGHIVGHIVRHWDTKWNTTRHTYLGDKTQNMPTEKCQVAVPPHQNVDKPQYTRQRAPTEKELGKALGIPGSGRHERQVLGNMAGRRETCSNSYLLNIKKLPDNTRNSKH